MSKESYIGGMYIETTGGDSKNFAGDTFINSSLQEFIQNADNGISYGVNAEPPTGEETKVKSIKCITALDEGSANDGSGTNTQEGVLHDKTYIFEVDSFTNDVPIDYNNIKWKIKGIDYDTGIVTDNILKNHEYTGKSLTVTISARSWCGCQLEVIAYIEDENNEGKFSIFQHNKFRWFDRMFFDKGIIEIVDNKRPWRIHQAGTSLCGMACIFYLFAKEQPEDYKKFATDLFRTGEATFNSYTAKPSDEILEKEINNEGYPINTGDMPLVDFVTMAGTRNTDNPKYKGGDEEFQAINWPPLMTTLAEELLGYTEVSSKGVYNPIKPIVYTTFDIKNKIDDINKQLSNGYKLILMIDADLIDDVWDYKAADLHWVVLESPITWNYESGWFGDRKDEIDFRVYTWQTDPNGNERYLKKPITSAHFMNNYNGYIKVK